MLFASRKEFYRTSYIIKPRNIVISITITVASYLIYKLCYFGGKLEVVEALLGCTYIALFIVTVIMIIMYYKNSENTMTKIKLEDCKDEVLDIIERFGGTYYTHYLYLNDKNINNFKGVIKNGSRAEIF